MSLGNCQLGECTFNVTGQCVLNQPIAQCSNREGYDLDSGSEENDEDDLEIETMDGGENTAALGGAVLRGPEEMPRLPSSLTMGLEEARSLMIRRNTTMVGILGLPDSGKTACLVSAYLLLASGSFQGYSFADSSTIMAFEQISRGSRTWSKGEEPGRLTVHTEMADDRQAGFLHLRLRKNEDGQFFDLLMPDLPGEWSRALIDKADGERLSFLGSATVIWLMVDGRAFADPETRNYAVYRAEMLVERLAVVLPNPRPRIILVPSWRDIGDFPAASYNQIREEGVKHGMDIILMPIASFSFGDVAPGSGVSELIDATLNHDRAAPEFWPDDESLGARTLGRFRSEL